MHQLSISSFGVTSLKDGSIIYLFPPDKLEQTGQAWGEMAKVIAPICSAIVTLAIGLIAGFIALRQWRTNQNKLKLDLFDRRFAIFDAAMRFIGHVATHAYPKDEALFKFITETGSAAWLFDDAFADYLKDLHKKGVELSGIELDDSMDRNERRELILQRRNLKNWFYEQADELRSRATPFLSLAH